MKNLILLSHPHLATSHAHTLIVDQIKDLPDTVIHHLEGLYPDGQIDAESEQAACTRAERIVMAFPFWWHSTPPMLKHWQDEVLTEGWAYGSDGGRALSGKLLQLVLTTGGAQYRPGDDPHFQPAALLRPLQATALLCGMNYAEPLILPNIVHPRDHALHEDEENRILAFAEQLQALLEAP
ncbi:glutathione-regulated potassium-efflux system ancillary protein KefF [Andreprevotia lacus DSM 23236]|uniref:Glutathione-regulated potassium-efflux system ancillary protein KefF n=1 Tax=Andreprevotia lacus DSM 23236 TaxID=1121001 RepID=A0A1W1XSX3_9NEIS|nr:NAD(P)H-dependent oxidoreductase [Andreprevotia lacus]SMC26987.1 glutathione-regulated potassium-efflux system ancillary protein KefF [Andreprevotia lacus DSM 23236]